MGWILGCIVLSLAVFAVVARRVMDAPVAVGAAAPAPRRARAQEPPPPPPAPVSGDLLRKVEARVGSLAKVPAPEVSAPTPPSVGTDPGPEVLLAQPERAERAPEPEGAPEAVPVTARTAYLHPADEAVALAPGPGGLPDAWLEQVDDRLLVMTPNGPVNPKSRTAASRAGLWSFELQVGSAEEEAVLRGDFSPGTRVRLVRQPDNADDRTAIAVCAEGAAEGEGGVAGYVPRGYAKRLAKVLDNGAEMVAVATYGAAAGERRPRPQVLVVESELWEHLHRRGSR